MGDKKGESFLLILGIGKKRGAERKRWPNTSLQITTRGIERLERAVEVLCRMRGERKEEEKLR